MSRLAKGIQALREIADPPPAEIPAPLSSASDAIIEALRNSADEAVRETTGLDQLPAADQSKPAAQEAPTAPSLLVSGNEAIRVAAEATEQDRVREYGLLAELDAALTANVEHIDRLEAVIDATTATLKKAADEKTAAHTKHAELAKQREETVDRIVKLNQMTVDNEAARLRRG